MSRHYPFFWFSTLGALSLTYVHVQIVKRTTVKKALKSKRADIEAGYLEFAKVCLCAVPFLLTREKDIRCWTARSQTHGSSYEKAHLQNHVQFHVHASPPPSSCVVNTSTDFGNTARSIHKMLQEDLLNMSETVRSIDEARSAACRYLPPDPCGPRDLGYCVCCR